MNNQLIKKWDIFRGRIKKKGRNIWIQKNKIFKNIIKNLLRFLGYSVLLGALFIGGLQVFQYSKNFLAEQENRKTENFALLEQMQKTQMQLFTNCQNENKTRRYLLLAEENCQIFLGENISKPSKPSLSENFLSFFHLFFVEEKTFPEVAKEMKEDHLFSQREKKLEEKNEKNAENQKIQNLEIFSQDPHISEYLNSFGYTLNKPEKNNSPLFTISKKDAPEKILAEISFNESTQKISATLFSKDKISIFPLENFISERKILETQFAQKNSKDILNELKNINLSEKNRDQFNSKTRENILLVGHNEGNTDTMIIANIDYSRKKITLISIPRDLWINGQRINAFRLRYGQSIFLKEVEKISGQKISGSFVVDMDVFPHLIDQMGGVDISFSRPLIDPTYKTNDNGKKGTLFFAKGTHHLSGIQALRVARSRHTTSDFSRAARQQKIIASLRKSVSQKNFLELLPLVKTVLQNVETDITPIYASKILWKTRNYELRTGTVISNKNILESKMIDVGQSIKAYALLPKNGEWDSIKKFIWREIEK